MTCWEYIEKVLYTEHAWDEPLDELGAQGWELVGMIPDDPGQIRLVFKRAVGHVSTRRREDEVDG